jgi:hypothetical protein
MGSCSTTFTPSLKLERKERREGRLTRICGPAQTPPARVLASSKVTPQTKLQLQREKARLNPFPLKLEADRSLKLIASDRRAQPDRVNNSRPHHPPPVAPGLRPHGPDDLA